LICRNAELHQQQAERLKAIGLGIAAFVARTRTGRDRADDVAVRSRRSDEQKLLDIEKRLTGRVMGADSVDQSNWTGPEIRWWPLAQPGRARARSWCFTIRRM